MAIVALNRRFHEWGKDEPSDPEFRLAMGLDEGGIGWEELLVKRRVVLLAEAGSGKSTEISERARLYSASGRLTFQATLEDVGRDGLEGALSLSNRARLTEWRGSTGDAWFFIDSIDEAKSSGFRFETVVRKLADGLLGAEERAHLILTGRITDWEFRRDLKMLKDRLPVAVRASTPGATPDEELLRVVGQRLRRRDERPSAPEQPIVVLMAPLDRRRVRLFVEGMGVPDSNRLLKEIETANLWHFARRPLDLDWLIRFWKSEGRLGSLSEMIERSIFERLKETNTDRAREDALSGTRARQAVGRIGAAMVFSRTATISIPDGEVALTSDSPLDLADILTDWSSDDRRVLLCRAIFDPATLGRARFHNDNEGVVRGYLTAQWLASLRDENLSTAALYELLFAKSYGLEVVRPSLSETAAWLSLWDKEVAREIVRRAPSLLLSRGDPASLPFDVRRDALASVLKELAGDDCEWSERPWWDNNMLRRFARPDLGCAVVSLWPEYRAHQETAQLLLRIAWLGTLRECAALVGEAARDSGLDPLARVFALRALLATGDDHSKKECAEFVLAEYSSLPSVVTREALVQLFPAHLGVDELLTILGSVDITDRQGGLGFAWDGQRLIERLDSASDLERLLGGLLAQLGGELGERAYSPPTGREKEYFPAIVTAALRLLVFSEPEVAPLAAIDAIIRVSNRRNGDHELGAKLEQAIAELHRTAPRRRTAFWRVASRGKQVKGLWQVEMLGYKAGLQAEDVEWLLEDGLKKGKDDCRLAVNCALAIERSAGSPPGLIDRIAAAAETDPIARETYEAWMHPPQPSAEERAIERRLKRIEQRNASEAAKQEQSWIDFIRELRSEPKRIAALRTPPASGFNPDLHQLWRLLNAASGRSAYAVDSIAPLTNIVGAEIAEAVQKGLIALWRSSPPLLKSQSTDRNSVRHVDLMGLVGVSLEAVSGEHWADHLSPEEAAAAAGYATLELNGFPVWVSALAASKPIEVRKVLIGEIADELSCPELTYYPTLNKIAYAGEPFAALVAPVLVKELEKRGQLPLGALSLVLQILACGAQRESTPQIVKVGMDRFENEADPAVAVQYLAAVFAVDADAGGRALTAKLDTLDPTEQVKLIDRFVLATFGGSVSGFPADFGDLRAETLERLVRLTFQAERQYASPSRPSGKVYRLDERDRVARARGAVFDRFINTPGAFTYRALLRFQDDPLCPIPSARLQALAERRAIQDSESAPWIPSEAREFELHHQTAPQTPRDLQSVLLYRLRDMQHDLLHGDFNQGLTLKAVPDEVGVQNWVADRLRQRQGRSFSVEREPHVIEEKEPDVRVRAKPTDAAAPMEIKVAESWSLKELEEALEVQLCGRYLRAREGRYGVLLLVHQKARRKGWEDKNSGTFMHFPEVVARLTAQAALIAGAHDDSPQPEVAVLDVSSCRMRSRRRLSRLPKNSSKEDVRQNQEP